MSLDKIAKYIQHTAASINLNGIDQLWLMILFAIVVIVVAGYTVGRFKTAIAILAIYGIGFVMQYIKSLPKQLQVFLDNKNVRFVWTILPLIALILLFLEKRKKRAKPSPHIRR